MKKVKIFFILLLAVFIAGIGNAAFAGGIVVYGDSQHDEIVQRKVVAAILEKKPAIVFRVGDIVNDGNDPRQWEAFKDINAELLKTTEYYPCLGNHENDSPLYFETFKNINNLRWYSVRQEGILFIVLDSNSALGIDSEQYAWLELELSSAKSDIRFILVFFHHPLFDAGSHKEDQKGLRPLLVPLFERYGVGAVFSGHNHNYQRLFYNGIYYIVTGGGGARLYDKTRDNPYLQKFIKDYHFCLLSVSGDKIKAEVFDTKLNLIDEFSIPKR